MSFLTPFYVLSALAIAGPILFHLIRRTPRGEVPFSSLMFLRPTPPKLTKRSRLENWFLLLLRAAALALLALAFGRPFLREAARLDMNDPDRQRVAILIDTSASMRRGDLWTRAKAEAAAAIDARQTGDEIALFAFDATIRPLLGFEESATFDPARRKAVAKGLLEDLSPTWESTDLGRALVDTLTAVEDLGDASESAGRMPRRIVLIADLQQGSRLEALGGFEWPADVELELKALDDPRPNAGLQRLADADPEAGPAEAGARVGRSLRVRVANDPRARRDRFQLVWTTGAGNAEGPPIDVYVPPGEGRVVRVPLPTGPSTDRALVLSGDAEAFDNTLYIADEPVTDATIIYLGADAADDPNGLLYYLDRVAGDATRRPIRVRSQAPAVPLTIEEDESVPLVVLATGTTAANAEALESFARDGGTVLVVLQAPGRNETLDRLLGAPIGEVGEARIDRDAMLGEIDFGHPLFAPLAGAQFNDFTKIHFWKYRRLDPSTLGVARVVARFEGGDPAIVERPVEAGRVVVLASGWGPADSQLARSSKFVPLVASLLGAAGGSASGGDDLRVGDRVPLPAGATSVRKPDGSVIRLEPNTSVFEDADRPGVYAVEAAGGFRPFAVNLDPAEGRTTPLEIETLEQFGCRLAGRSAEEPDPALSRQLQNAELEGRQKLWRPLVVAVLFILILETVVAGRQARTRPAHAEVLAS